MQEIIEFEMEVFWSTGNTVKQVDFSPDSKRLACMRAQDVYVCDILDLTRNRVILPMQDTVLEYQAWSADSYQLAIIQRDSPVVTITKFSFDAPESIDDERWVDLKNAGKAVSCGWNPIGWLAIVANSGKIILSHEQFGSKWCSFTANGQVSSIESSDTSFAFAIVNDGIAFVSISDGSLLRRVSIGFLDISTQLMFKPFGETDTLAVFSSSFTFLLRKNKKPLMIPVEKCLACDWSGDNCVMVAQERNNVYCRVYETTDLGSDEVKLVKQTILPTNLNNAKVMVLNANKRNIFYTPLDPTLSLLYSVTLGRHFEVVDEVSLVRDRPLSSVQVSRDGRYVASLSEGVIQLALVLNKEEQVLKCLVSPYSLQEFLMDFLCVGGITALLLASLIIFGTGPVRVYEIGFQLFAAQHYSFALW